MFMRYLLLAMTLLFYSCKVPLKPLDIKPIVYPDKNLKEIKLWGDYIPEIKTENFQKNENNIEIYSKERFEYKGDSYCYNKEKNKEPIFNQNLRARLYNEEGKMLSEDFLRIKDGDNSGHRVISYIPYHYEGHRIYIISLEGNKGTVIKDFEFLTQATLRRRTKPPNYLSHSLPSSFWTFGEKSECHGSPGTR